MRFPSRLIPRAASVAGGFMLVALSVAIVGASGGCADKHVGRPCQLGTSAPDAGNTGGNETTLSSPALECPSRICLLPGDTAGGSAPNSVIPGVGTNAGGTGPVCTYGCSSDDDCSDGEIGDKSDPADHRCKSNFVCTWATTVGPFCCEKLCVCHDFLIVPAGGFPEPEACKSSSNSMCANVH